MDIRTFLDYRRLDPPRRDEASRSGRSATQAAAALRPEAGLFLALLLSLGLWWAIWLGVSSLAASWLS
ncbi:MAG: hypothetical protein WA633_24895 [Stellaceae bacterium]